MSNLETSMDASNDKRMNVPDTNIICLFGRMTKCFHDCHNLYSFSCQDHLKHLKRRSTGLSYHINYFPWNYALKSFYVAF